MTTPYLSEGARLLAFAIESRGMSLEEADALCRFGERSGTCGRYVRGARVPGRAEALRIESEFGIAATAWDMPVAATEAL